MSVRDGLYSLGVTPSLIENVAPCDMPELNLSQAARLYGKSRMTLHRHCGSGRVTSRLSDDGQRLIDLSELIRVYGEPPNRVTPDTSTGPSQRDIPEDTIQSERDDLLLRELQALREQVHQLHEEVRDLRRLPAPEQFQEALEKTSQDHSLARSPGGPIRDFADILRRFEAKQ